MVWGLGLGVTVLGSVSLRNRVQNNILESWVPFLSTANAKPLDLRP